MSSEDPDVKRVVPILYDVDNRLEQVKSEADQMASRLVERAREIAEETEEDVRTKLEEHFRAMLDKRVSEAEEETAELKKAGEEEVATLKAAADEVEEEAVQLAVTTVLEGRPTETQG